MFLTVKAITSKMYIFGNILVISRHQIIYFLLSHNLLYFVSDIGEGAGIVPRLYAIFVPTFNISRLLSQSINLIRQQKLRSYP